MKKFVMSKSRISASRKAGPTEEVYRLINALELEGFSKDEIIDAVTYLIPSEDVLRSLLEYGHAMGLDFTDLIK